MSGSAGAGAGAQLEWEARMGKLAAGAAFASAALVIANTAIQVAVIGRPDNKLETLKLVDEYRDTFFVSLGAQVVAYVLLAGALFYLFRATVHRRPEVPRVLIGLLVLAPLLLAVGGALNQISLNDLADTFLASAPGQRTEAGAKKLLEDQDVLGGALLQGGIFCLAGSFVFISLYAMRAGLLSRFMGVLGIIVGVLLIVPLLPGSVVQVFWLGALGMLFLDRWPNGRGPAWETGEAVPWPSAADAKASEEDIGLEPPRDDPADQDEPSASPAPRTSSRKRKRKRR